MEVEMIGGPEDGKVIESSNVCNRSDVKCPVHGYGFNHGAARLAAENSGVTACSSSVSYVRSMDNPEKAYFVREANCD